MFMPSQDCFARAITHAHPTPPTSRAMPKPASRPAEGMLAGTLVETLTGWLPVERLFAGDAVQTLDGGLRQVRAIRHQRRGAFPRVLIPGGTLGNNAALALPADQLVLVDGAALEALFDLPQALARVGDLHGLGGIRAAEPAPRADLWQMIFDEEELVWTAGGLRLHCPSANPAGDDFFHRLSPAQARLYALSMNGVRHPAPLAA